MTYAEPENKHRRGLRGDFVWCGLSFVCQDRRGFPGLNAPMSAHACRQDDWAPLCSAEATIKLQTLQRLRAAIPAVTGTR
jgi:hypothetical protein